MFDSHKSVSFYCLDAGRHQRFSGAAAGRQGEWAENALLRLILMGDWCDFMQPGE
jgi:hypothetical protein